MYASASYAGFQAFGERVRAEGGVGLLYDSPRLAGGMAVVSCRPRNVLGVPQVGHYGINVQAAAIVLVRQGAA